MLATPYPAASSANSSAAGPATRHATGVPLASPRLRPTPSASRSRSVNAPDRGKVTTSTASTMECTRATQPIEERRCLVGGRLAGDELAAALHLRDGQPHELHEVGIEAAEQVGRRVHLVL